MPFSLRCRKLNQISHRIDIKDAPLTFFNIRTGTTILPHRTPRLQKPNCSNKKAYKHLNSKGIKKGAHLIKENSLATPTESCEHHGVGLLPLKQPNCEPKKNSSSPQCRPPNKEKKMPTRTNPRTRTHSTKRICATAKGNLGLISETYATGGRASSRRGLRWRRRAAWEGSGLRTGGTGGAIPGADWSNSRPEPSTAPSLPCFPASSAP